MKIDIYADGSATMAGKPGGFGWVLVVNDAKHSEGNGFIRRADNNEAELEAAMRGLDEAFKFYSSCRETFPNQAIQEEITLYSDSQITLAWANGSYLFKHEAKYEKFNDLRNLVKVLSVKTKWVRAHAGHQHNERCDELAALGRLKLGKNDQLPRKPMHKKLKMPHTRSILQ